MRDRTEMILAHHALHPWLEVRLGRDEAGSRNSLHRIRHVRGLGVRRDCKAVRRRSVGMTVGLLVGSL
jgi:hypothetical protein